MYVKQIGWLVGSLGLLLGAGAAWADDKTETTGQDVVKEMAGKPECGDTGVTVAFKTSSAELDQNAKGALDGLANWMKANPARTLRLQGYADPTGSAEANLKLSERRAESVKSYLVAQGVDPTKVTTIGEGELTDHLPASGRAVTFLGCAPASAIAEGTTVPPPTALQEQAEVQEGLTPPPPPPVEPVVTSAPPPPPPRWARGYGWSFMAGGAFQDFTNQAMKSATETGGGWDLRFIGGVNSFIGFEAAYVGSTRQIETLGVTANTPSLVSNGVEGTLRVNLPVRRGNSLFEPYAFGGVGFARNSITNYNSNTSVVSSFTSDDNILTVPAGGGFAYGYKAFIADVRAGWTPTFNNDMLLNSTSGGSGAFNTWNVGGQAGFIF